MRHLRTHTYLKGVFNEGDVAVIPIGFESALSNVAQIQSAPSRKASPVWITLAISELDV
jgi:hypothetical protein